MSALDRGPDIVTSDRRTEADDVACSKFDVVADDKGGSFRLADTFHAVVLATCSGNPGAAFSGASSVRLRPAVVQGVAVRVRPV